MKFLIILIILGVIAYFGYKFFFQMNKKDSDKVINDIAQRVREFKDEVNYSLKRENKDKLEIMEDQANDMEHEVDELDRKNLGTEKLKEELIALKAKIREERLKHER